MTPTYAYAIVPSPGRYGSGEQVRPVRRGDDLAALQTAAERMTRTHQQAMRKHGGTSGGYRVVTWGSYPSVTGWVLDRSPDA